MNQFAYKGVYSSITSMKKIGNPSCLSKSKDGKPKDTC